jgi:16S rRNA C967 or C1407 C5-methylase (RsmB/RsmF family)
MEISNNLQRFAKRLFSGGDDQERFLQSISREKRAITALVWLRNRPVDPLFHALEQFKWQADYVELLAGGVRAGAHQQHQLGDYYCLDSSSVFASAVLSGLREQPGRVLDLCAAPGGKSVLVWRRFQPDLLVANEVIGKRLGALISNLKRCQIKPVLVTAIDSKQYAEMAADSFDLVIVDAPCSGQSLLLKGKNASGCFHPAVINKNSLRQKRIIANSAKVVAPGGYLAYHTCTFSLEENEQVIKWLLKRFPKFEAVPCPALLEYQSKFVDFPCYRLWPWQQQGAGAFTALLCNNDESAELKDITVEQLRCVWEQL